MGENVRYIVEAEEAPEELYMGVIFPDENYTIENEKEAVNLYEAIFSGYHDNINTSTSSSLNVPYYQNGGANGYCWDCCAASMCAFWGTSINLATAHSYVHSGHTLYYCNGGNLVDVNRIIGHYAYRAGTITYSRRTPSFVMSSIASNKPLVTSWGYYYVDESGIQHRIGHEVIVCGYIYDNTSNMFTYVLRDPNVSNYVYLPSSYTASSVTYTIGGNMYNWESTLDSWLLIS